MLRIDSLDAHEQRVGARTVAVCQRLLRLRNQLADFAGWPRNAHRISSDREACESSKRARHDRQCNRLRRPFVRRQSCMLS